MGRVFISEVLQAVGETGLDVMNLPDEQEYLGPVGGASFIQVPSCLFI